MTFWPSCQTRSTAGVRPAPTVGLRRVGIGSGGLRRLQPLCAKNTTSGEECAFCPLWPPGPPSTVTLMTLHEIVATDPLAPLTGEELETVVAVLRQAEGLGAQHRFVRIDLREPPKADVEKWQPGVPVDRCGLAVVFDRAENAT